MKNKVLKVTIAVLLIMAMIMADFLLVGVNVVTYALENGADATNHTNVKFSAYFKVGEEELSSAEYEMNSDEMKLYIKVSVNNEGYFDGVIALENSNFKLKQEKLSEYVSKIDGNVITLNRVRAGNTAVIELGIEPIISESYEVNMLSKESALILTGYYTDSMEKSSTIKAERHVTASLTVPSNIETTLEGKVITNKVYQVEDEKKRIVQIELNSGVVENAYPIKATTFEILLPAEVEEIEVISKGTYATDGKADKKLEEGMYEYDEINRSLRVTIENNSADGKISWKKDSTDLIVVTLILAEDVETGTEEYIVKAKVEFEGKELEKEISYKLGEEADGIIRALIENNEEIYKGKIYSKEEREYKTTTNIEVNYANIIEGGSIEERTVYKTEVEEKQANIEYKTTTISKSEIEKVLGEEGTLSIQNGTKEELITAQTEADANGNIVITYQEGVKELKVEIKKAVETGIIRLKHTKAIKEEQYMKEEIDNLKYLVETVTVKYNDVQNVASKGIELKDIVSSVVLTGIPETITTEVTKEIPIVITLKTNEEKYELFENPIFILTMPEGVMLNSVLNGTISATNEELTISKLELINDRQIRLEVTGKQQKYVTSNINTQINLTANISIEKLMPNKVETIKLHYENKGKQYDLQSEPINVVASNSKIVTHLKVENYNGQVLEDYNESITGISGDLPLENTETIQVPVEYTIINNYDSEIDLTPVIVANYIDNEENKENLINYGNPNFTISAGEMQVIEETLTIPTGLYFNEKIDIDTLAEYSYFGTTYDLRNEIILATEDKEGLRTNDIVEEKLKIETFAQLGDGTGIEENAEVFNEQIIQYIIEVTNISNQTISNINVTNRQENGKIYDLEEVWVTNWVESSESYIEHRYAELDTSVKTFEIETLNPGESKELLCKVVAKKSESSNITTANISISANGIEEQNVQGLSNTVKDAEFKISTEKSLNEEVQMYGNMSFQVLNNIENLTTREMSNLKFRLYLSEGLSWKEESEIVALDISHEELDIIENIQYFEDGNYIEIDISKIEANQKIIIASVLKIEPIDSEETYRNEKIYFEINDIISNSIDINIEQSETKLEVKQTVNIDENQKVKNNETVIFTGEISNLGSIDANISIEDDLPDGLQLNKIEIFRNGILIEEIAGNNKNSASINIDVSKGEKITINIHAIVVTALMSTEEVTNKIWVVPGNGNAVVSNDVVIQIESDIKTDVEIEEPEETPDFEMDDEIPGETPNEMEPDDGKSGFEDTDFSKGDTDDTGDDNPDDSNPDDSNPGDNNPDDDNPGDNNPDDDKPGDDNNPEDKEITYSLSGKVWVDLNQNGNEDNNEGIKNVIVKIIDVNNKNTFLKDQNGNEIEATSDANGKYVIKNIPEGKYNIIFKYDTSIYELKPNNVIKDYIIESTNEKVAITNNINVNENQILNLELIELTEFDLKVEKYISKVVVQTVEGTTTTEYANKQLVREEIRSKHLPGATVLVEYTIKVSNVGALAGYAIEILDYLPADMKFHSELNTEWYKGEDGNIYNTSLASTLINPGESKNLKLVLAKTMTKNNTGTTANIAEISGQMNIKGYDDINSNNNQSKAEIIVNPATGIVITYIMAVLSAIAIVAIGMYIINQKVIRREED